MVLVMVHQDGRIPGHLPTWHLIGCLTMVLVVDMGMKWQVILSILLGFSSGIQNGVTSEFEKDATEEGNKEAAALFKQIAKVEKEHRERYKKLLRRRPDDGYALVELTGDLQGDVPALSEPVYADK